jgi:alpha-glucosidase (family GH31 glycosyl hydrolase)
MLAFQVPFTTTAGNVGCFFWSHDMGGFTQCEEPEKYARWL